MIDVLRRARGKVQVEDRHYLYQSQCSTVCHHDDNNMKINICGKKQNTFVCKTHFSLLAYTGRSNFNHVAGFTLAHLKPLKKKTSFLN